MALRERRMKVTNDDFKKAKEEMHGARVFLFQRSERHGRRPDGRPRQPESSHQRHPAVLCLEHPLELLENPSKRLGMVRK